MHFGLWKSQLLENAGTLDSAWCFIPCQPQATVFDLLIFVPANLCQLVSLKTNELQRLNDVPQEDIIAFVGGPWSHRAWAWHTKGLVQKCPVSTGLDKFSLLVYSIFSLFQCSWMIRSFFGQRMSEAQISASWIYPNDPLMIPWCPSYFCGPVGNLNS